ncbi:MAG: alkaline phosphatase family protein [Peptococcaceae bacterium]|nr:alkaline phosphatase family protein [Peptococcaceae bacterium]
MNYEAAAKKILVLGVDALDPRLTRKYVDEGKMPNVKKYIEAGACREDLVMLGGHPTVTPPMWTTLACGCYANVHGITGYYRASKTKNLDTIEYNLDSRLCTAEPVWNCFAEAGKKTLVWHWPGSSWPPTSDSPNLMVVDGTSPGAVGMAVATIETDFLFGANVKTPEATFVPVAASNAVAPCVVENLELNNSADGLSMDEWTAQYTKRVLLSLDECETAATETALDMQISPIKEAKGWANAPAGAKETVLLCSKGLIRYPGLILQNEAGEYDRLAFYKSKKDSEPFVVLEQGKMVPNILGEAYKGDDKYAVSRNMKLLSIKPDGSELTAYISAAMDIANDSVFHPTRLHKEIIENIGYIPPTGYLGCQDSVFITDCMLDCWNVAADWQADAIMHLIRTEELDVVFSHFHNVDLQMHKFIKHMAEHDFNRQPVEVARKWGEDVYVQTDNYLGKFLPLLDEGWTIFIISDHAQVAPKHDMHLLMEASGLTVGVMKELGYTVLQKDENGNEIAEVDWSKTTAVAVRECNIYINLKGRDPEGIVDPADKYELEEKIMTDLYGYRDPKTGHRIVSVALRNRDAVLLGYGGPECGDICYWMAEGYNFDHDDCLSTTLGEADTSVSPIFIGAGPGLKKGFYTDRIIRQADFAPTVAVLGGVRMPQQCEGAPVYQILDVK